jgi:hypothetical protein
VAESTPAANQEEEEDGRLLRLQLKTLAVSGQIREEKKKSVHFAETRRLRL